MTAFALAAVLQVSLAVSDSPYQLALKKSVESGRPVLVLVGADWCHYCGVVKRDVLPVLKERGLMDKVEYVYLDYDRDSTLVGKLQRGEIIPEMMMLRKTAEGWERSHLSGGYKVAEIETFIKSNLKEVETKQPKGEAADKVSAKSAAPPAKE